MPDSLRSERIVRAAGPFLVGALIALIASLLGTSAVAQEGGEAPPPPDPVDAPAPDVDVAPPEPDEVPAADDGAAAADAPASPASTNGFVWFFESAGIIGIIIILLSVTMVAMIIRLFLEFRLKEAVPPPLVDTLDEAIRTKKFQEAYDACRDDDSFLARLVRTGVANMPNGRGEAKEAMNATAEEIVVGMESMNSYLGIIGTIAPMLGLLGTVLGMIMAFQNLATVEGVQVDPTELAGNISTALVTTFLGLIVSVPAIFFFGFFRNRIIHIATETTKIAERTINAFWQAAKQQQPVAKPAP